MVELIRSAGGEAEFFELDVTDEDSVREVTDAVVDRYGSLTTLVNNAAPTVEEGPHNIRCNAIVVGRVVAKGDLGVAVVPGHLTRQGAPTDIAYAATYLAADESIYVTGSVLTADGGATINAGMLIG